MEDFTKENAQLDKTDVVTIYFYSGLRVEKTYSVGSYAAWVSTENFRISLSGRFEQPPTDKCDCIIKSIINALRILKKEYNKPFKLAILYTPWVDYSINHAIKCVVRNKRIPRTVHNDAGQSLMKELDCFSKIRLKENSYHFDNEIRKNSEYIINYLRNKTNKYLLEKGTEIELFDRKKKEIVYTLS